MTNLEKRDKYAQLMKKLENATNNEYYYEALFIEYAIFEERTRAIFKHANVPYKNKNDMEYSIDKKLRTIKTGKDFQDKYIKKHITEELLDKVINWKDQRNQLMHNIIKSNYDNEEVKNLALQGECIAKKMNSKSKLVNDYFDSKLMVHS